MGLALNRRRHVRILSIPDSGGPCVRELPMRQQGDTNITFYGHRCGLSCPQSRLCGLIERTVKCEQKLMA